MGVRLRFEVRSWSALAALVVACAGACGDDAPGGDPRAQTTTEIGSAGGDVVVDDVTLSIPAGALATPTKITIRRTDEAAPTGVVTYSAVYRFEPEGLTFATPALVKINHRASPSASVYWTIRGGDAPTFERLASTDDGAIASANIDHFSGGFVGVPAAAADAGPGDAPMVDASHAASPSLTCTFMQRQTHTEQCDARCVNLPPDVTVVLEDPPLSIIQGAAYPVCLASPARPLCSGPARYLVIEGLEQRFAGAFKHNPRFDFQLSGAPPLETTRIWQNNCWAGEFPAAMSGKMKVVNGDQATVDVSIEFWPSVTAQCKYEPIDHTCIKITLACKGTGVATVK